MWGVTVTSPFIGGVVIGSSLLPHGHKTFFHRHKTFFNVGGIDDFWLKEGDIVLQRALGKKFFRQAGKGL